MAVRANEQPGLRREASFGFSEKPSECQCSHIRGLHRLHVGLPNLVENVVVRRRVRSVRTGISTDADDATM